MGKKIAKLGFEIVAPQLDWRIAPWSYDVCIVSHLEKRGIGCERYCKGKRSIVMSNTKYPVGKQNAGDFSQIVGTIQEQTRWKDTMTTRSWLMFRENSTRSTS